MYALNSCTNFTTIVKVKNIHPPIDEEAPFYAYFNEYSLPDSAEYVGVFNTVFLPYNPIGDWEMQTSIENEAKINGGNCIVISGASPGYTGRVGEGKIYRVKDFPRSEWTETKLLEYWTKQKPDKFEGFYDVDLDYINEENKEVYSKYAVVKIDNNHYNLIYLSGFENYYNYYDFTNMHRAWREGDVCAFLERQENTEIFKLKMYSFNKIENNSSILKFDDSYLRIYSFSGLQQMRKIYPEKAKYQNILGTLTGFAIDNKNIVTCYHGFKNKEVKIYVKGLDGDLTKRHEATLEKYDKENDIAVIKLKNSSLNTEISNFTIAENKINASMGVFVLGYPSPSYLGDDIKYTDGILSAVSGVGGNSERYQFTAPVQPGNSGSPIFDQNGNILGMVDAGIRQADNVGYAIKLNLINDFLKKNSYKNIDLKESNLSQLSKKDKISKLKNQIFLIEIVDEVEPVLFTNEN